MKPLLKTSYCNLPLSVPEPWKAFFDHAAGTLGISRNAAMCLALRLGGPILDSFSQQMKNELKRACRRISKGDLENALENSEILGTADLPLNGVSHGTHEREKVFRTR
jgi:hypothetical protein